MSVMALQGRKSSPQKSRPLESGHRRHVVWIAIEYSYKLGQESEFKFWCELGWFLQRQSQMASNSSKFFSANLFLVSPMKPTINSSSKFHVCPICQSFTTSNFCAIQYSYLRINNVSG